MKIHFIKHLIFLCTYLISSSVAADGVDIFTSTQIAKKDNIEIICTSSFEAPYDNLYAYESVWNWALFGGYFSWVPVKVGEKYTGEFRYSGMSCFANRKIFNTQSQQNETVEISFNFNVNGQVSITSSNIPLDISIEDYTNTYESAETVKLIVSLVEFGYDANKIGLIATLTETFSPSALIEAGTFTVIARLVSNSVFIYLEQNEIKQQISAFMNNDAAGATKNTTERILTDIITLEATYKYSIVMPAINHILLF